MILSHSFYFVKCGYTVFSPFFCVFCHLSHRPGTTSGVARKIGTGDARGKGKPLVFSLVSGANATVSRSLSANATAHRPHVSPVKQHKGGRRRGVSLGIRFQVDSLLSLHKIPCRFPACFGAAPAIAFSGNFIFPKDPLLRFRRYSAARTMRSGYTLLVRSVDPSGQIMSRTYPSSPNVTGISTVRVS